MTRGPVEPAVELGQKPTLARAFEDLSDAHERARETVEGAIDAIALNRDPTPPAIRGPLRSGKTALQYHTFTYAWKNGVPALYVEASRLLKQFEHAESESFGDWVEERAREQVAAFVDGALDEVDWLPNDTPTNLQEWFDGTSPATTTTDRVVLLIDEVEQNYTKFLSATGVDDGNPLRTLLDRGRLFPVLSMGQISAMEFVGFADMKRTDPVSIPPVTVDDIRALLTARGLDPALARVVMWLTRGRAAHVHQVVTDADRNGISFDDREGLNRWLGSLADETSPEFRTVRRVWQHPDIDDPGAAAAAVAFDENGHPDWLVESETWRAADDLVDVLEKIVLKTDAFTASNQNAETITEARQILTECIERVVDGIAVGPSVGPSDTRAAVPTNWLTGSQDDRSEGRAFLSLVQDILLSFEAERPARNIAFDALEDAKERFRHQYDATVATVSANNGHAWTLRPSVIEETYPPLSTDPSRLTGRQTDELREVWDVKGRGGIELSVDVPATVFACPTEAALRVQLEQLLPDPTHPTVMLVDGTVDAETVIESVPLARALEEHSALSVVSVPTARVWTFVVQLSALLEKVRKVATMATDEQIDELLTTDLRREQRTTVKTLYNHLTTRVAGEAAATAVEAHRQQFTTEEHYVWAHPTLAGTSFLAPRGGPTAGRHSVLGLLALGCKPVWDDPHGRILMTIRAGLDDDIIATNGGFGYKELLNNLTGSGEYGKAIRDLRRVCREEADTAPTDAVTRATNAFADVIRASGDDRQALLSGLSDQESASSGTEATRVRDFVASLSPTDTDDTTPDVLWALVTASLAREDESYVVERLRNVENSFEQHVQTLEGYLSDARRAEDLMSPTGTEPDTDGTITGEIDALSETLERQTGARAGGARLDTDRTGGGRPLGVLLDTSHLTTYRENLCAMRDAVRDAKRRATMADFRPSGYALAVLAARYEDVVCTAVHELERVTPSDGDLNHVKNLISTVRALQSLVDSEDIGLSAAEHTGAEVFISELLDFRSLVGERVTVGDLDGQSMEAIDEVNRAARIRTGQVEDLVSNLEELDQLQQQTGRQLTSARRELKALVTQLTKPDADIDEEASLSNGTLLGDGEGDTSEDEANADEHHPTTDANDAEDTEDEQ